MEKQSSFLDHRFNRSYPLFTHRTARPIIRTGRGSEGSVVCTAPQARLTSGSPVVRPCSKGKVVRGLDFLKVSFWVRWDPRIENFLGMLDEMKKQVQETELESIPVFPESGFDWNLSRSGTRMYVFRMRSGDISLLFNRRREDGKIPNCRLEIGSLSCWSPGFYSIYQRVQTFLKLYGGTIIKERVSEAHLTADFVGTDIKDANLDNRDHWIALARNDGDYDGLLVRKSESDPDELAFGRHFTNRRFSGLNIGSGDLMLRVYDKVTELKRTRATNKQQVFSEIWGSAVYDAQPVTRVEYQVRRPKLREFSDREGNRIDTVDDLIGALKSLWGYLTTEWTRHSEKPVNRNHNQTKSKVSEFWEKVQAVVWTGVFGYIRTHLVKHKDIDMLRKQARGILMSVCASLEVEPDDIDKIVYLCKEVIEEDLHAFFEDERAFVNKMISKRNEFRSTLSW
ncbi:MAG: hypothetical protein Q4G66_02565 [bacterium]|nr:hypothetical protein [bacterium]